VRKLPEGNQRRGDPEMAGLLNYLQRERIGRKSIVYVEIIRKLYVVKPSFVLDSLTFLP
jgi:hypothetical protein